MTNTYKIHYQYTAFKRLTFEVTARDELEAWREARKTLGLPDGVDVPPCITIIKDEPKDHPSGRECLHMDRITCPYCGYENQDSWEFRGHEGEPLEDECGMCERTFIVTMYVNVTYTSMPKETSP